MEKNKWGNTKKNTKPKTKKTNKNNLTKLKGQQKHGGGKQQKNKT